MRLSSHIGDIGDSKGEQHGGRRVCHEKSRYQTLSVECWFGDRFVGIRAWPEPAEHRLSRVLAIRSIAAKPRAAPAIQRRRRDRRFPIKLRAGGIYLAQGFPISWHLKKSSSAAISIRISER